MIAIAIVGLVYALFTYSQRNKRHPPGPEAALKAKTYRPAELPALGFLPLDTNLVAAIHVAQLWENPEGKKLLETPWPGTLDWLRRGIDKWTGLPLEAVDHIALGTQIKDRLPQLTMVVQTRGLYDPAMVAKKHATALQLHKKPLFPFKVDPVGEGLLWCPNNQTLVFVIRIDAVKIDDMATVPIRPWSRLEMFPEPLREAIQKRLPPDRELWTAGHFDNTDFVGALLALLPKGKVSGELISKVQTFALGLDFETEVTLQGALHATDAKSAEAMKTMLEQQDLPALKVIRLDEEPGWVALQARGPLEPFRESLKKMSALRLPAK